MARKGLAARGAHLRAEGSGTAAAIFTSFILVGVVEGFALSWMISVVSSSYDHLHQQMPLVVAPL